MGLGGADHPCGPGRRHPESGLSPLGVQCWAGAPPKKGLSWRWGQVAGSKEPCWRRPWREERGHQDRGPPLCSQDLWMFPSVLMFHPEAARALLEYRIRTLPGALDNARDLGYQVRETLQGAPKGLMAPDPASACTTPHPRAEPGLRHPPPSGSQVCLGERRVRPGGLPRGHLRDPGDPRQRGRGAGLPAVLPQHPGEASPPPAAPFTGRDLLSAARPVKGLGASCDVLGLEGWP